MYSINISNTGIRKTCKWVQLKIIWQNKAKGWLLWEKTTIGFYFYGKNHIRDKDRDYKNIYIIYILVIKTKDWIQILNFLFKKLLVAAGFS